MPLSEKVRIEIYLPDVPEKPGYELLLNEFSEELAFGFGGSSIVRGIQGTFRSQAGTLISDSVNLLYVDLPYTLDKHFDMLSRYTDALRQTTFEALDEEAILVVAYRIYWSMSDGAPLAL